MNNSRRTIVWQRWRKPPNSRFVSAVWCCDAELSPSPVNHVSLTHSTVFTLELSRQRLLVLLVLQCHRLRPLQLFVHLVRHHPAVHHPTDHREQQQELEDPSLSPGAHPVTHVGPAPLRDAWARMPRLCCGKLPTSLLFVSSRWTPTYFTSPHPTATSTQTKTDLKTYRSHVCNIISAQPLQRLPRVTSQDLRSTSTAAETQHKPTLAAAVLSPVFPSCS